LAIAIRSLQQGYSQLGPTIAPRVFAQINPLLAVKSPVELSLREREVLRLIRAGYNNREIAGNLNLTEGTVKNYVTHVLTKLQLRDRTQAALWAKQNSID
jgi:DNA-binding NarL/FixJ family response regulator